MSIPRTAPEAVSSARHRLRDGAETEAHPQGVVCPGEGGCPGCGAGERCPRPPARRAWAGRGFASPRGPRPAARRGRRRRTPSAHLDRGRGRGRRARRPLFAGRYRDGPSIRTGRSRKRDRPVDDRTESPAAPCQSAPAASRISAWRPAARTSSGSEGPSAAGRRPSAHRLRGGDRAARLTSCPWTEIRQAAGDAPAGTEANAGSTPREAARTLAALCRSEGEITADLHFSLQADVVIDTDVEDHPDEVAARGQRGKSWEARVFRIRQGAGSRRTVARGTMAVATGEA